MTRLRLSRVRNPRDERVFEDAFRRSAQIDADAVFRANAPDGGTVTRAGKY